MDGCEAPPADHPALRRGLTLELLDMDQTVSLADTGVLSSSPLSLLSPNAPRPSRSPAPRKPAARPAEQRATRPRSRKPDPRRQSSAIFAGFAAATAGAGLLADDEIAVGDDDILISLPTAAKSQVAGAPGTHLWLEPHTDELLGGDLPEPEFGGGAAGGLEPIPESPPRPAALAGGLEPILESPGDGEEPAACSSPVAVLRRASPAKQPPRAGASPLKLPGGVRDSTAITEGLSKLCLEVGLSDLNDDDFELQDGNKVKEMAFLFRAEADALAAPSPKASTPPAQPFAAEAAGGAAAARDGLDAGAGPCSVKARVQQLQSAAKPAERPKEPRVTRQPAAASAPSTRAAGAASKAAAPAPRPSRLRPPSTSSSYFSHTVTETRPGQPSRPRSAGRAATVPGAAGARAAAVAPRAASAARSTGAAAGCAAPAAKASTAAASPARTSNVARPSTAPSPARPSPAPSRQPVQASPARSAAVPAARAPATRSRLAQSSSAQAPTPQRKASQPGAVAQEAAASPAAEQPRRGMFNQRTLGAAASRLRPPTAPSSSTPSRATPQAGAAGNTSASKLPLPKLRLGSPAVSPNSDNLTPNTARIRYLEQHPELVFGGGSKVGNSPVGQPEQEVQVRRKTAEERHLEEWGDHL